ncbi:magnesium-translocating P-type ATPase [Cetobacterium ceti]
MKNFRLLNNQERLKWCISENIENIFITLKTNLDGLNENSVINMREIFGENVLSKKRKDSVLKKFIYSFINPFTIILFILASISFFTEIVFSKNRDFTGIIIITIMIFVSGILRFLQEFHSNNAVENLNKLIETTSLITRNNILKEIPVDEIVVGDLITLKAGDIIPADIRLIQSKDFFISQSSLTGESDPIEKFSSDTSINISPLESKNLVFMGSNVVSGSAKGIVIATGDDSILGTLAVNLNKNRTITSFEKGINSVSKLLIIFMIFMVLFIFMINGIMKQNWFEAFLFSLSIGIGLTPEMLPMIISANLAKGAKKMAKNKVIIKNLNAIQNLGAIDILCTDKTGTLTEDKIVLNSFFDINHKKEEIVLKYGFLNSFYQTSLKNLIDMEIINYFEKNCTNLPSKIYRKLDEIPFDFHRRRMSVLLEDSTGKIELITKGAMEEIIDISIFDNEERKNNILEEVKIHSNKGLKVIGICKKELNQKECSLEDEYNMTFIGYLTFWDLPKESAKQTIESLIKSNVQIKILTGDSDLITSHICSKIGLNIDGILLGSQIENLSDEELKKAVETNNIFVKLSPDQKKIIIKFLKENGHVVGFLGDGINDALAMKESDVGISVDTATSIAKESADIILLEKSLLVLKEGIIEGRKIYGNIIKYIKMTTSSNFGNMFSVLIASIFLPFLPMYPLQILTLNLIYDISCISIPWDNVDSEFTKNPKKWDASSIKKFILWIGPSSSIFDIITYLVMYFLIIPLILKDTFINLNQIDQIKFISLFNTGWFIESLWSQTLVIYLLRTSKISLIKNKPSWQVILFTFFGIIIGTIIPFSFIGTYLSFTFLPYYYFIFLFFIISLYILIVSFLKIQFIKKYKELL